MSKKVVGSVLGLTRAWAGDEGAVLMRCGAHAVVGTVRGSAEAAVISTELSSSSKQGPAQARERAWKCVGLRVDGG